MIHRRRFAIRAWKIAPMGAALFFDLAVARRSARSSRYCRRVGYPPQRLHHPPRASPGDGSNDSPLSRCRRFQLHRRAYGGDHRLRKRSLHTGATASEFARLRPRFVGVCEIRVCESGSVKSGPAPPLNEVVNVASAAYHLDPDLVNSVIHAESGFNARAVSPKGARGLMQLMPGTASQLGVNDPSIRKPMSRAEAAICANFWNATISIWSRRWPLITRVPSGSSSIGECRHFAKPAPTWPASCTNTTPRRLPRKKRRNKKRPPLGRRARLLARLRATPKALRNPPAGLSPPDLRVDFPKAHHPSAHIPTLTLLPLSFTFIPGACSLQLSHSSASRQIVSTAPERISKAE
jgi:hypothetical protein